MTRSLVVLLVSAWVTSLDAQGPPPNAAARARGAQKVVVGTVTDLQSRFDVNQYGDRLIVTEATLDVEETLKGGPSALERVDLEGGSVGDLTLSVSDMPVLRRGDRAVFFLEATTTGSNRPHGRGLGVMKVDQNGIVEGTGMNLTDVRTEVRGAAR